MAEGHGTSGEEHVEHVEGTLALLFMVTCFVIGISTKFFLSWVKIPYTALLLIWGLCIGLIQAAPTTTVAFTDTLYLWMNIDPHLLLLIFLPTIGFSAGINQEPHLLRKNWGQILILAGPGVVITFVLIGVCAHFFFPYGWTWPQCLLFGAMLSATDPVAVVAVLQEVGADEKLGSVIDGESLVNDGSALVVFLVLQRFVQGESLSAGQIAALFCQLALLGATIGLAFGLGTSLWLSRIWRDPGLDIVLTFTAAYTCYFVSEELLGASGLLAVVVMGFSMSLIGGRQITQRFKLHMHAFWQALEWMANSILFIWVGVALALILVQPSSPLFRSSINIQPSEKLEGKDVGYAVVLYLWLLVARACAIGTFYPLLSTGRIGYALGWRQALVMIWAGLRGAVGVAMSLFIFLDPLIEDEGYKVRCIFFMALMAFSTVIVNGSTTKLVLQKLGLLDKSPEELQVLEHIMKEVEQVHNDQLSQQPSSGHPLWTPPDLGLVSRLTKLDTAHVMAAAQQRVSEAGGRLGRGSGGGEVAPADLEAGAGSKQRRVEQAELVKEYRRRFLCMNKAHYAALYNSLYLTTPMASALHEGCDKALDQVDKGQGLQDWPLMKLRGLPAWVRLPLRFKLLSKLGVPAAEQLVVRQLRMVSALVSAHQAAQQYMRQHLEELSGSGDLHGTDSPAAAAALVLEESQAEVTAAVEYGQQHLVTAYPGLPQLVSSWEAAVAVVRAQEAFVNKVVAAGLVAGEELHNLQDMLSNRLYHLMHITAVQLEAHQQQSGSNHPAKMQMPSLPGYAQSLDGDGARPAPAEAAAAATVHDQGAGLTAIKEGLPAEAANVVVGGVEGPAAGLGGPSLATSSVPLDAVRRRLNYTQSLRTSSMQLPTHPAQLLGDVGPSDF